jgi:hypothetical protein
MELPLAPDREACCAVEALQTLPARGVRLRTRALTTTMFARLLLGDLFIHGIGGAKYDELGDELIRGFFRFEPPAYLTLSETVWLGLKDAPATRPGLEALQRRLRDLRYNPDRHLPPHVSAEVQALVEAKQREVQRPVSTRRERDERFLAIRRYNEQLQPLVESEYAQRLEEQASMIAGLQQNTVARSREYAFVLHSESHLHDVMDGVRAAAGVVA